MPLRRLILNVDFFGRTQSFSIAKRDSFPTYLGSFLSFTIISTLIYFVIYFGLDLINKSQLNLITSTIFVDDPPSTYINETLFTFSTVSASSLLVITSKLLSLVCSSEMSALAPSIELDSSVSSYLYVTSFDVTPSTAETET